MIIDLEELFASPQKLDEKSSRALIRALKSKHNDSTFDYIKFKQSVEALKNLDMDVATAYKSAFATAMTMGLTKDTLLKSANGYAQVLEYEKESFAQALKGQIDEKIQGRREEVNKLAQKIEDHKRKIQELEREISIFQNRIDNVDQDVESANAKIEETKAKFLEAYDVLNTHITEDIDLIKEYI
jgi:chromosome segregation ATPase